MDLGSRPPQPHPRRASGATHARGHRTTRAGARLRPGARRSARDPLARLERRPPAADLQREPRHRRGRTGDRGRDRAAPGSSLLSCPRVGPWRQRSGRPGLERATRGGAAAQAGARRGVRASLLLPVGLVADLNDRSSAPAGQERGSGSSRRAAARDLTRLRVVTRCVGGDSRRRRAALVRLERRGRPRVRCRSRARRDAGRRGALGVPDRRRRDDSRGVDARPRAA